jgi:hypothetical protein
VGNYLIANPSNLGNFMIADRNAVSADDPAVFTPTNQTRSGEEAASCC